MGINGCFIKSCNFTFANYKNLFWNGCYNSSHKYNINGWSNFTICYCFFLELTTKKNIKLLAFIRNILLNPMILSILIGVLLFVFNINIADTPVDYILSVLAACVSPVGLFAIGITLSFYTKKVINQLTASISILKLLISPIILLIIGFIFFDAGVPEKMPGAFFVSVAPCGHTAIVLCSAYNVNPENIIKALFISTFASMGTIFFAIKYLTL